MNPGIIIEMVEATSNGIIDCMTSLFSHILYKGRVPNDWNLSYLINLFKGKGGVLSCVPKRVHKRSCGIRESLRNSQDFMCKSCSTVAEADDHFPTFITIDWDEFETVSKFCYLGDVVGQPGGCFDAVTARIRSVWKAFRVNFYLYSRTEVYHF